MPQAVNVEPIEAEPVLPSTSLPARIAALTTKVDLVIATLTAQESKFDVLESKLDLILSSINTINLPTPVMPPVDFTPVLNNIQAMTGSISQLSTNVAGMQNIITPPITPQQQAVNAVAEFNDAVADLQAMLPGVTAQVASISAVNVDPIIADAEVLP